MNKELLKKIGIGLIIAAVCIAVMLFGMASGLGAPQCFAGVAC